MTHPERRRSPRIATTGEHPIVVDLANTVRLIDVSVTGVLLASKTELVVGDRRELRFSIGARTVNVPIEIRHTAMDGVRGYLAGAVILPTTLEQRGQLEELFGATR
jgi:hypothetical protein